MKREKGWRHTIAGARTPAAACSGGAQSARCGMLWQVMQTRRTEACARPAHTTVLTALVFTPLWAAAVHARIMTSGRLEVNLLQGVGLRDTKTFGE